MESSNQSADAALEAWNRLCSFLATACAASAGRLEYRQPDETSVLIQEKEPPRALRLEYSPDFKKLRYNTGSSGWQELNVCEPPQKTPVFETPHHQEYTSQEVCNLVLERLERSRL
jgi:hypothetical protein